MWHRDRIIAIPYEVIAKIRASPTDTMGWFEEELQIAWRHLFPITPTSLRTRNLALDHPAWGLTPNPWWRFLTDTPLLAGEEAATLNKQKRSLVVPHLDKSGWLVQERKVIDSRGSVSSYMGNFPTMKLFQILTPIRNCDLLLCCREDIVGILKYMIVWKPNWMTSKDFLRRLGWSMMETTSMTPNQVEVPYDNYVTMNILLWNCRGALNVDFKRRVLEMTANHHPSIMVITETRVRGDRVEKIIEDLHFDGFFCHRHYWLCKRLMVVVEEG